MTRFIFDELPIRTFTCDVIHINFMGSMQSAGIDCHKNIGAHNTPLLHFCSLLLTFAKNRLPISMPPPDTTTQPSVDIGDVGHPDLISLHGSKLPLIRYGTL